MQFSAAIFDMDGLLIDSEPFWNQAADTIFQEYGFSLSPVEYATTTGMRTREFVAYWFHRNKVNPTEIDRAGLAIIGLVVELVQHRGKAMPGVEHIINFCRQQGFRLGLATSSPMALVEVVMDKLGLHSVFEAVTSAEHLPYGKPHPQVYLNCAEALGVSPLECLCFEDSFNGMIAAKAARMTCIVVPGGHQQNDPRFQAADMRLSSLQTLNGLLLQTL